MPRACASCTTLLGSQVWPEPTLGHPGVHWWLQQQGGCPFLSPSSPGSFGKRGAVSPTTFQTGAAQLARGALCPLHPASRTWAGRTAVGGLAPSLSRRAARLSTSDDLPPTSFCSYRVHFVMVVFSNHDLCGH